MPYRKYVPSHLYNYITQAYIPGAQDQLVQAYMKLDKLRFCDRHVENAIINDYRRLVKHYMINGAIHQCSTFYDNLKSFDVATRKQVMREYAELPNVFEGGYLISAGPAGIASNTRALASRSGANRNISVWEIVLQMAARYGSRRTVEYILSVLIKAESMHPGISSQACKYAMCWAAYTGREDVLRMCWEAYTGSKDVLLVLSQLNNHLEPPLAVYAYACNADFVDVIATIVPVRECIDAYAAIEVMVERKDIEIYRKLAACDWIQEAALGFIREDGETWEYALQVCAAKAGFYEVLDMPWLNDDYTNAVNMFCLPDLIFAALTSRNSLRFIEYLMKYPIGKSLAKDGKLTDWAIEADNYILVVWLIKNGYPPRNTTELLARMQRYPADTCIMELRKLIR